MKRNTIIYIFIVVFLMFGFGCAEDKEETGTITVKVVNGTNSSLLYYAVFNEEVEFAQDGTPTMSPLARGIVEVGSDGEGQAVAISLDTDSEEYAFKYDKTYKIAYLLDVPSTNYDYTTGEGVESGDGGGLVEETADSDTTVTIDVSVDLQWQI